MGKRNITVTEGPDVSTIFKSGSKTLQVTLRPEVYAEIKQAMSPYAEDAVPEHINDELVNQLILAGEDELFTITR